jgi:hypothetical protein
MKTAVGMSVWGAMGIEQPRDQRNRRRQLVRLPGNIVVERELAQIVAVLTCNGVCVGDHGSRGWGSPISYIVLGSSVNDLDVACALIGHGVDPDAHDEVARLLRDGSVDVPQAEGMWLPSGPAGWAVGAVREMTGTRAAIAWPASQTPDVERAALDGRPPVPVRTLTVRQWARRHPAVVPRRVWEQIHLTEDHPSMPRIEREIRRVERENARVADLMRTHRRDVR